MRKNQKTFQARVLRKNLTPAEQTLWQRLRYRQIAGFKFRRQHPIGPYICDFVCLEKMLVVEVDGGQHASAIVYDQSRSRYLKSQGFEVMRFWNNEVLLQTDSVLGVIYRYLVLGILFPPP